MSAISAVIVRRGSMSTIRISGRRCLAAAMRWYRTGWHQARFEPTRTIEIGQFEVFIGPRDSVCAEGAAMSGDRGGHAESRIGVDIGRADEAFHQLVGDVIILGQQLPRDIKGDAIGAMCGDAARKCRGDEIERLVPIARATVRSAVRATVRQGRWFRRAPILWSRGDRNSPDGAGRRAPSQPRRQPGSRERRNQLRNKGRWFLSAFPSHPARRAGISSAI